MIDRSKRITLIKEGTGTEDIDDDPVEQNMMLTLTDISVADETTPTTKTRIGQVRAGYLHACEEQGSLNANELVHTSEEHHIYEGGFLRCQVTGGAANDTVKVYLEGYTKPWKE